MYIAEMQKRKRLILCYSEFRVTITLSDECFHTEFRVTENRSFLLCISAINALYFVRRAPYGGEDSTLYVIYIYI